MKINKLGIFFLVLLVFIGIGIFLFYTKPNTDISISQNEPVFEDIEETLSSYEKRLYAKYPDIKNWQRPEGSLKVAIQAGHWKNSELPDELERLRGTSLGASSNGYNEWEVNLDVAEKTAELLKEQGMQVEILPATVPIAYWADLFIAIHADGNTNPSVRGFKASGPRRDMSGKANEFVDIFYDEYSGLTNFPIDPNITRNMSGYYAFNWFRNEHSIHPMTTGVIIETGFLTNAVERNILVNNTDLIAQGIANSVIKFLLP